MGRNYTDLLTISGVNVFGVPIFISQPIPVIVGPAIGPGPAVPILLPEMTTGVFLLPALPPGAVTWVAKTQFDCGIEQTIPGADPVEIVIVVDGVPDPTTVRSYEEVGGAGGAATIAVHKNISLAPGPHSIDVFWSIPGGAGSAFMSAGVGRQLSVEVIAR